MLEPGTLLRALPAIENTYDYYRRYYTHEKEKQDCLLKSGEFLLIVDMITAFDNNNIADYYRVWVNGIDARMYATTLEQQIDHLFEVIK